MDVTGAKQKTPSAMQAKLEKADLLFLKAQYKDAAVIYSELSQDNVDNPYLWINLGNSQLKQEQFGKAYQSYYKAKAIIPRNKEVNNNIELLNSKLELNQPALLSYQFLSHTEAFVLFIVMNIVFLLRNKLFKRSSMRFALSLLFIASALNFAFVSHEQKVQEHAAIIQLQAQAYSGDNAEYTKLFELYDGQIVKILERNDDWSKVQKGQELGWVENSSFAKF